MASNQITGDGTTPEQKVNAGPIHIAVAGSFGGGTVSVEYNNNNTFYPLLNEGAPIQFTTPANVRVNVTAGDVLRLTMSGSTSPAVDYHIAGAGLVR